MVSPSERRIFRSENEAAQTNSKRSRASSAMEDPTFSPRPKYARTSTAPLASVSRQGDEHGSRRSSNAQYLYSQSSPVHALPEQARALSLRSALPRNRVERALDRFFLDWIMYPCCAQNACAGYLHPVASLYQSKSSTPILHAAVEALAFANVRGAHDADGRSFGLKARARYGNAVQQLRHLVTKAPEILSRDDVVASILLLDNFELIYANRASIPGSHGGMLYHILTLRLNLQIRSGMSHPFWRAANYRLLVHLILTKEDEKLQQLRSTFDLSGSDPYTRMVVDAFEIAHFRSQIKNYTAAGSHPGESASLSSTQLAEFSDLVNSIWHFVGKTKSWVHDIPEPWKPQRTDLGQVYNTDEGRALLQQRLDLSNQSVLKFHSLWIAALWATHWACLLLLHESLAEAVRFGKEQGLWQDGALDGASVLEEEGSVKQLASNILQAVPFVFGHIAKDFCPSQPSCESGMMLTRLFFLFPLTVVERSVSATPTQISTAANVRRWLQEEHRIS